MNTPEVSVTVEAGYRPEVTWVGCGRALVVLSVDHPGAFSVEEGEWVPREEIPNLIACLERAAAILNEETA